MIGLSEKEAEIYIFISKKGTLTGTEITRQLKMNKGQTYRLLKSLQRKDAVETTLEYPKRFVAVPFKKIIDAYIKSKREEVDLIEDSKKDLLEDWEKIIETEFKTSVEKFSVIEGKKKIFDKISQMILDTNSHFSMALTVSDLLKAEQYGLFDLSYDRNNVIEFRVLTQLSKQNLKAIKHLQPILKSKIAFRVINSGLGATRFSRMAIRDNDGVLLFISDNMDQHSKERKEVCFCTNSKSIIQAFSGIFDDFWKDSIDIEERIIEIVTDKSPPRTQIYKNPVSARNFYCKALDSAQEEILIVTSSKGLIRLSKNKSQLEELSERGIAIRIMAPIVTENLHFTQRLLKWSEIRHIPIGYFETTIIDGHHLFQIRSPSLKNGASDKKSNFENTFYTSNVDYIQKTKKLLFEIWKKTRTPSLESLRSINRFQLMPEKSSIGYHSIERKTGFMKNMEYKKRYLTEKDVQDKIYTERKHSNRYNASWTDTIRFFGYKGFAAIYPPTESDLPDMIIGAIHHDEDSTFGVENWIYISMAQKNAEAINYVPIAIIQDNAKSIQFRKRAFEGYPVANNIILLEKKEIQINMKGNTLFAGWTKPISLGYSKYTIPPACLLFEGYGDINSGMFTNTSHVGRTAEVWHNSFDAFISFFLPKSKYVGSGNEAFFERETVLISRPPKLINKS